MSANAAAVIVGGAAGAAAGTITANTLKNREAGKLLTYKVQNPEIAKKVASFIAKDGQLEEKRQLIANIEEKILAHPEHTMVIICHHRQTHEDLSENGRHQLTPDTLWEAEFYYKPPGKYADCLVVKNIPTKNLPGCLDPYFQNRNAPDELHIILEDDQVYTVEAGPYPSGDVEWVANAGFKEIFDKDIRPRTLEPAIKSLGQEIDAELEKGIKLSFGELEKAQKNKIVGYSVLATIAAGLGTYLAIHALSGGHKQEGFASRENERQTAPSLNQRS